MFPYLFLMAVPVVFALMAPGRRAAGTLFAGFLVYTIFVGFRYEVGPDWTGYLIHSNLVQLKDLSTIWTQSEPGYWTLLWLSDKLGWGIVGVNVVAAIIFFGGLFTFAARTDRPWIAIAAATSYLVLALGMSGIRQAMAMGFIFFVLANWSRTSNWQKLSLMGAAALFHFSAIIMVPLLAFGQTSSRRVRIAGALLGGLALFLVFRTQSDSVQLYVDRYIGTGTVQATGAIFQALLNAIPAAIYVAFRKRWNRVYGADSLLSALSIACIALLPMLAVSTVGVSRVAMYLTVAPLVIWAGLPRMIGGAKKSTPPMLGALGAQVAVMMIWLTFANVAFAYFPYRNILFMG